MIPAALRAALKGTRPHRIKPMLPTIIEIYMARPSEAATSPVERFFQFSVLGFVASGYFAVVGSGFLDFPTTVLMAAALVIRGLYSAGVLYYRVPPRAVTFGTIAYMAFYAIDDAWISRSFAP